MIAKAILYSLLALPACLTAELTFSMIKPTAVQEQKTGEIIAQIQQSGLKVVGLKMTLMPRAQAELFYQEHKERPFYPSVIEMITAGPVVMMVIEGDNAVLRAREIIGSIDPKEATGHTIRARFGKSRGDNAIHGSDSVASAQREIAIFFTPNEMYQ